MPNPDIVRDCLVTARSHLPDDVERNMGWVLIALGNAFHRLLDGQDLEDALVGTVAMGGDTDTNAAICGALLGALQGREAIPLQWRNAVLTCRPVRGSGIHHPRPADCWPDDALDLAEALLAAGC